MKKLTRKCPQSNGAWIIKKLANLSGNATWNAKETTGIWGNDQIYQGSVSGMLKQPVCPSVINDGDVKKTAGISGA